MSDQRQLTGSQALLEATDQCLAACPDVVLYGLGVSDPKGVFGTTLNLHKKHGTERVFDVPVSEDAITGMGIGAALMGMRPIVVHQRLDFALLALDTLINNAAKWHYMFDGQYRVPMVVRMVVGRGWGQGPQHSQSLQALFAHIPGLKVVMPVTPYDTKGLMIAAVEDENPVIFIEHRWLHSLKGEVPREMYRVPLGEARVARPGKDVTIVASSFMVLEALRAAEALQSVGVDAEVIDLRTIAPLDRETIRASVRKTGRLLVADTGHQSFGISAEIVADIAECALSSLKAAPVRVASPDVPCPTTDALARHYYPRSSAVAQKTLDLLNLGTSKERLVAVTSLEQQEAKIPTDIPDMNFKGPF